MTRSGLPRFAELTYSSFDHGNGEGGGWQVKDVRGGVTRDEQRFLTGRIPTQFDSAVALAPFPTPDELAARPARLEYGKGPGAAAAYWHVVEAGVDASGRPGNVFAHVLLDRSPGWPRLPLRPADLIDSPMWLRPFGAAEVLATSLESRSDPPWSLPPSSRAQVLGFLTEGRAWPAVLAALLDAVEAALRGGRRVVLGADAPARAGLWISAVNHLMSAGTSRRLYWSTHERAAGLPALWAAGTHLAVVPTAELALIEDRTQVVLIEDDRDAVDLGDASTPHHTRAGSNIPVQPWSTVVGVVLADRLLAEKTLDIQEQVATAVGDRDLDCGWPLAMAVAHLPNELGDALPEATAMLAAAPPGLADHPELSRMRKSLLASGVGPATEDAWTAVSRAEPASPEWEYAVGVFLSRAVHDARWLGTPPAASLPVLTVTSRDPDVTEAVRSALAKLDAVPGSGLDVATHVLRLVDLVARAGYFRGDAAVPPAEAQRVVDEVACPLLFDPAQAQQLIARVGWLDESTHALVVRPSVSRRLVAATGKAGTRLLPAVLQWLYPQPPATPDVCRLGPGAQADHCLLELAAQVTLATPDPSRLRIAALWGVLDSRAPSARDQVARLADGPLFAARDLRIAIERFDVLTLAPALVPVLLGAAADEDLWQLGDAVLAPADLPQRGAGDPFVARALGAAALRRCERVWVEATESDRVTRVAVPLLDAAEAVLVADPVAAIRAETLTSVLTAYVIDVVHRPDAAVRRSRVEARVSATFGPGPADPSSLRLTVARAVVRSLCRAVQAGVVEDLALVLAAQYGARDARRFPLGCIQVRDLGQLQVAVDAAVSEPVLERVVQTLNSRSLLKPKAAIEARGRAVAELNRAVEDEREAQRVVADLDRFLTEWWASVGVVTESGGPWFKRSRRG